MSAVQLSLAPNVSEYAPDLQEIPDSDDTQEIDVYEDDERSHSPIGQSVLERAGYCILSDDGRNPSTIVTGGEGRTGIAVDVSVMETVSIRSLPHSDTTRSGVGPQTLDSADMISNGTFFRTMIIYQEKVDFHAKLPHLL